jgi:peptide/nickel transport system substrate-binding protein
MGEVAGIRAVCDAPAHLPMGIGTAEGTVEERFVGSQEDCPQMIQQPRRRLARLSTVLAVAVLALLPAAAPAVAADPVVLRVGTTQPIETTNPWNTYLVSEYDSMQLTYDILTGFGEDSKPAPGFADSWERGPDRVTYHIRDGMKFSDGTPATAQDVCFSWGLALAAIKDKKSIGYGYLEPGLKDAGVTKIECPDDSTFIAYTTDQSDRIFQVYVPILPKHVWSKFNYKNIDKEKFDAPLVGSGPYTLAESKTNQFARFVRNPNYWGNQGFADEVVLQFYSDADTMVQALKAGELDYAHSVNPDQFKQLQADPTYTAVAGKANGWTQLAFNTYGTGTGKTIPNGGPSTKALLDPAFRDALGYAVDKQALVDRVLGGFGDVGTTNIPPVLSEWHVEPDSPRHFDIELAKQKLDAAGYVLNGDGKRLDKEGKPIQLRLYFPNTDDVYAKSAQFVSEWYGQLGIDVTLQGFGSTALGNIVLPPEGDGKANYDIELWGWGGNPDPNALLDIFTCGEIGTTSDSQYCNPAFDALYEQELGEAGSARHDTLAKMQNLIYDEAPYDILFYDANLDVYRNDKFAGWENMPADGTPLFSYGTLNYTLLRDATAEPPPTPEAPTAAASEAPGQSAPAAVTAAPSATAATGGSDSSSSGSGSNTTLLLVLVAVVAVVVVGGLVYSRRRASANVEDE